jgi:signal transduction histidine kinase
MMIVLDLKLALFIVLLVLSTGVVILVWLLSQSHTTYNESDESLFNALLVAPFGILILENDTIIYSNIVARELLHMTSQDEYLPNTDWRPLLLEDCTSVLKSEIQQGHYRVVTFASGKSAQWWIVPLYQRAIVFLIDVSSQIRTQQTGRSLVNDLGHELRTPIATILTHLEILGLENIGSVAHEQSLDFARKEAHRMGRLINDMLELGRLEIADELVLRPVNILPLVNDVIIQSTPSALSKHMDISLDADAGLPMVMGNSDRLRQVFLNLVDNAIKYASDNDHIEIHLHQRDQVILCSVCDTGPGIPIENQPYITQRFYRATPSTVEGSGLGLSLVAEILRRHNTELRIESPVSDMRGTCMHFSLSRVDV